MKVGKARFSEKPPRSLAPVGAAAALAAGSLTARPSVPGPATAAPGACCVLLASHDDGQYERDGDDGERARELHDGGVVKGVRSGMHAVPGGRGGGDRRGVVHGGAGEQPEALVGHAEHTSQGREDERRDDVEQEDDRDGLGHLLVLGADDRRRGGDGRAAADGRAHGDERGDGGIHAQHAVEDVAHDERRGDGGEDDRQALGAHGGDLGEVQPEAQQDDGVLQHLFRCEADAVLHDAACRLLPPKGDDHADEDGEHRAAHHGQRLAEKPAGKGRWPRTGRRRGPRSSRSPR